MKTTKLFLGLTVLLLLVGGSTAVTGDVPGDLHVTYDAHHRDFFDEHSTADFLEGNLTEAGSTFTNIGENDTFAIPDTTDVLLMPGTDDEFPDADATAIKDWFASDGPKLFWAAGDSDFSGFFDATPLNTLLTEMGADLRLGADSVEDENSNDGAAYRVASTGYVTDGDVNSEINEGLSAGIITHGPSTVMAEVDGEIVSIADVNTAEVLVQSSADAVVLDSDLSETKYDYYATNEVEAPYPMIAIQDMGDGKWVIVSGEAVFSDYKFMYGVATESGEFNGGTHEGKAFVDNVLSWFSANAESASIGGLPLNFVPVALGIGTLALIVRKRN